MAILTEALLPSARSLKMEAPQLEISGAAPCA
jgi:hypothetical protein